MGRPSSIAVLTGPSRWSLAPRLTLPNRAHAARLAGVAAPSMRLLGFGVAETPGHAHQNLAGDVRPDVKQRPELGTSQGAQVHLGQGGNGGGAPSTVEERHLPDALPGANRGHRSPTDAHRRL